MHIVKKNNWGGTLTVDIVRKGDGYWATAESEMSSVNHQTVHNEGPARPDGNGFCVDWTFNEVYNWGTNCFHQ
jgi:hypothetical protein